MESQRRNLVDPHSCSEPSKIDMRGKCFGIQTRKMPEAAASIPGISGNMLTLLGGPRACIGYRFAIVEMKALLFTLVRAFEFELAVPPEDIGKSNAIVQRPLVLSDSAGGNQMPLLLSKARSSDLILHLLFHIPDSGYPDRNYRAFH